MIVSIFFLNSEKAFSECEWEHSGSIFSNSILVDGGMIPYVGLDSYPESLKRIAAEFAEKNNKKNCYIDEVYDCDDFARDLYNDFSNKLDPSKYEVGFVIYAHYNQDKLQYVHAVVSVHEKEPGGALGKIYFFDGQSGKPVSGIHPNPDGRIYIAPRRTAPLIHKLHPPRDGVNKMNPKFTRLIYIFPSRGAAAQAFGPLDKTKN